MMPHVIAALFLLGGCLQLLGLFLVWWRLRRQRKEVEQRDALRAELAQHHEQEIDAARARFMESAEDPALNSEGDTLLEWQSRWIASAEHGALIKRHQDEDAVAGVAGMTYDEVTDLFSRGPDAAVQFLVAQQLSGYGLQVAVVGLGTALGVVGSLLSVYLLPVG